MSSNQLHNTTTNGSVPYTVRGTTLRVVESCIFILLDLAALVGNSLVCLAFYRNPSLRTVTNYFILSLALTDLSAAVLAIPLGVSSTVANRWITGNFGCKIEYFCGYNLTILSLLTVMTMAINRYLCVTNPVLFRNTFSEKRSTIIVAGTWTVSAVIVVVLYFISGIQFHIVTFQPSFCFRDYLDTSGSIVFTVILQIVIAVPSVVIIVCYVKIYLAIHQHNITVAPASQGGNPAFGIQEAKLTRMLTVVVVGFYLCWFPVFIANILIVLGVVTKTAAKYSNFFFSFPILTGSVINPVIYAAMNKSFRRQFLKILHCEQY